MNRRRIVEDYHQRDRYYTILDGTVRDRIDHIELLNR